MPQRDLPWFADGDDSDRQRRMTDFQHYAQQFFRKCAPSAMRRLSPDDLADVQQEIILHCICNDFRVLKQFRNTGSTFDAWFCVVSLNTTLDFMKRRGRYQDTIVADPTPDGALVMNHPASSGNPEKEFERGRMAELLNQCIGSLDQYCRVLVRLYGDQFKPHEIVRVLRWPESKATKVANDYKYCKEKLRKLLAKRGIVEASV